MKQMIDKKDDRSYIDTMSKREAKKEHLLDSGLEIMKIHGYNGTSVKDIVDAAGVPKGSFYNYFDSKEDFAVEAIESAARDSFATAELHLLRSNATAHERLHSFFSANVNRVCDDGFQVGCFLGNMGQEMSDSCELIRQSVQRTLANITGLIARALQEAKSNGELEATQDPQALAEFLFNAWEGALLRMKTEKSRAPLENFLGMLPRVLKS